MFLQQFVSAPFTPVFTRGSPGPGVGGYDLADPADRAFAFDYDSSGRLDHVVLYRPGTGTMWILKRNGGDFTPVFARGSPGPGVGGYDLIDPADRAFAFDYDSSGRLDHVVLYRPGTGTMWILKRNGGDFTPVFARGSPGPGVGGYDLMDPTDRVFAFDYDSSGKLDHLVLYRPGTGTIRILKRSGNDFASVFPDDNAFPIKGIGGYDLRNPADRAFAFDFDSSGKLDHLVLYRPGTGTLWVLKRRSQTFEPVFAQGTAGDALGGYDLMDPADRAFAFDFDSSGKLDHLVFYRPGTGTMWMVKRRGGSFVPVVAEGSPGNGIGGYDLIDPADRAFAFDYNSSGKLDHLALYRPGLGTMWILKKL